MQSGNDMIQALALCENIFGLLLEKVLLMFPQIVWSSTKSTVSWPPPLLICLLREVEEEHVRRHRSIASCDHRISVRSCDPPYLWLYEMTIPRSPKTIF